MKDKIKEIILQEIETDSKYHGLDMYSVNTGVHQLEELFQKEIKELREAAQSMVDSYESGDSMKEAEAYSKLKKALNKI